MRFQPKYFLLVWGLVVLGSACTDPPPPALSSKDRNLIDSLVREKIKKIKPVLDSICDAEFDTRVKGLVDSIMKERLDEIDIQLKRKQQLLKQPEK